MEDFDIYDDATPDKPFIIDYQSRVWGGEEVPGDKPIEVDPIKLNTEWIKAVDRTKDSISFMSYIRDNLMKCINGQFPGYDPGQLPSYMLIKKSFRTHHPSGEVFSKLSKRYPIQPDTDSKD
jgi:hypothetical protein